MITKVTAFHENASPGKGVKARFTVSGFRKDIVKALEYYYNSRKTKSVTPTEFAVTAIQHSFPSTVYQLKLMIRSSGLPIGRNYPVFGVEELGVEESYLFEDLLEYICRRMGDVNAV
ncbi:MAG: hypothetical protein Pg6A_19600 [Termitinemataceae bacterium]|nr:MAG: hypothetical protein Pg6A_19600 [Termitinemataceae bacterium]